TAATAAATGGRPFTADRVLAHGDLLPIPGRRIRALHTPGHTPGHLCLVDDDERLLFTGDHLLPTIFPGLGLGGPAPDALGDYLRSLDAVEHEVAHHTEAIDVLPGHGFRFTGLAGRVRVTRAHHLARSAEIAAILQLEPEATVWQTAERVTWTAGFANLSGFYLFSALAQTAMHREYLDRRPPSGASRPREA
ncbi:MAG: MBL fold metallo-hydrolase, partial [Herbiconiux sp.]|nr:MBL fold metallo-hydrolase [Herbiconiux sp.]